MGYSGVATFQRNSGQFPVDLPVRKDFGSPENCVSERNAAVSGYDLAETSLCSPVGSKREPGTRGDLLSKPAVKQ